MGDFTIVEEDGFLDPIRHNYDKLSLAKSRFNNLFQDRNCIYERCHWLTANFNPKNRIEIIEITSPKFINTSARSGLFYVLERKTGVSELP